jgi:hypothetical protein
LENIIQNLFTHLLALPIPLQLIGGLVLVVLSYMTLRIFTYGIFKSYFEVKEIFYKNIITKGGLTE